MESNNFLTTEERQQLRNMITMRMSDFLSEYKELEFAVCMPDDFEPILTNSVMAVMDAVMETNQHFFDHHIIEEADTSPSDN